jgi:hypothetical protein
MRDEDKNNSLCTDCDKRIGYVRHLEQELNYSMSYTDTSLHARDSFPMGDHPDRQFKNGFWPPTHRET